MEKDGITRVFRCRSGHEAGLEFAEPQVRQVYPVQEDDWTFGQEAVDTSERADFAAVHASRAPNRYYAIYELPGFNEVLDIDVSKIDITDFQHSFEKLVKAVEEYAGKEGLTIRVG